MRKLFFLLYTGSLLWAGNAYTQQKNYVYKDTVIAAPPQAVDEEVADTDADEEDYSATVNNSADTTLYYKNLLVSADTVAYWKSMPAFGYTRYLDSLLKVRKAAGMTPDQKKQQRARSSDSKTTIGEEQPDDPVSSEPGFFASGFAMGLFWFLAVCFVGLVLYLLFFKDGFFKGNTLAAPADTAATTEEAANLVPGTDMDLLIAQALRTGNYRLATRYQYLKCLHRLCDRNILQFAPDKTNYQYVQEIANGALRNDFAALTLSYEYVWYGEFAIDETIYKKLETAFTVFWQKI